ncbi:MAG: TlpA disulfide reductase family protein [Bacteroidota bacterium]
MKRLLILFPVLLLTMAVAAQNQLEANLTGCNSPLKLFQFNGIAFDQAEELTAEEANLYAYESTDEEPRFYYLGTAPNNVMPIILGGDAGTLSVRGNCQQMRQTEVSDEGLNQAYAALKRKFDDVNRSTRQFQNALMQARSSNDEDAMAEVVNNFKELDEQKRLNIQSARETHPLLGRIAAINTFLSYQGQDDGTYGNEINYYVNTFFQFVDHEDTGYNILPWTYEGTKNFTTPLVRVVGGENLFNTLAATVSRWPEGSQAQFYAMGGVFAALMQAKNGITVQWADMMIERFADTQPSAIAQLRQQMETATTFLPGFQAPEIEGQSPEGETIKLSDLRGQYVLLDFWASWCGPCRRENPNVVRVYNEYHERGFEILGVSLDNNADRWKAAIEQDGLSWPHISDLGGWRSAHARAYGVTSIPETILLDPEGKIVARGLRGATLEAKLAEILGAGR